MGLQRRLIGRQLWFSKAGNPCRGVAKLVKAPDFDSGIRRFESFFPCQMIHVQSSKNDCTMLLSAVIRVLIEIYALTRIGPSFDR